MHKYKLRRIPIKNKIFYFDNNATTFVYDDEIKNEILTWLNCGNPSNVLHTAGIMARKKIDESRKIIAGDLGVDMDEIYFTSGATEANNLALQGLIKHHLEKFKQPITIISSNFEHPSVMNIMNHYKNHELVSVITINVKNNQRDPYYGSIDPADVEEAITSAPSKVLFVSIMYANNETGAIQNIAEIGKITKKHGVYFHSDATQAIGKFVIKPRELNLDSITFSAHKFHGPKGIGCLYLKKQCDDIENICYGGEQEASKRPGTENVAFIVAMALALKKAHVGVDATNARLRQLRTYLKNELSKMDVECIEPKYDVLPNTLLVILKNIDTCNKNFAKELNDVKNICVGVSSACQTSHNSLVLEAMKLPEKNQNKVMRISMSVQTTPDECQYLVDCLRELLIKHRNQ
jgi:cysteine desulfurase